MLVHLVLADADLHCLHHHFQFIPGLYKLCHICHNRIRGTVAVYILICKKADELYPITGTILIFHGDNQFIFIASLLQYRSDLLGKQFPAFRVIAVIFIRMIVKKSLILRLGIAY